METIREQSEEKISLQSPFNFKKYLIKPFLSFSPPCLLSDNIVTNGFHRFPSVRQNCQFRGPGKPLAQNRETDRTAVKTKKIKKDERD
jgi:hypothetical protein